MKLPILPLLFATLLTFTALAQSGPESRVEIEAETGPVTVNSIQPPIANASDYRVTVADLDKNGDERISRSEVPSGHALQFEFKLVDANRDGRITQAELSNWK